MIINYNWNKIKLPNVFIIGVQKAWTTTIFDYLTGQHGFFNPWVKEPHYFTPMEDSEYNTKKWIYFYEKDVTPLWLQNYSNLYNDSNEEDFIIDGSTHYFFHATEFIEKITKIYGENVKKVKIIVSFREPTDRAYSAFNFLIQLGLLKTDKDYGSFMNTPSERRDSIMKMSLYSEKLSKIIDFFGLNNTLIINYDDIRDDWRKITTQLEQFFWKKLVGDIPRSNVSFKFKNKIWKYLYYWLNSIKDLVVKINWNKKILFFLKKINKIINIIFDRFGRAKKEKLDRKLMKDIKQKYFSNDIRDLIQITGNQSFQKWID